MNSVPFRDQESVSGDAERGMMVKATPTSTLHGDRHLGPHAGDRQVGGEDTYWPSSPQADVAKAVGVIAKRKP